jgi:hypothetical protein
VQAAKEIIDEVGEGLMDQAAVDQISKLLIDLYHKSDERIKENNELAKNEQPEDEDDQVDEDDLEVIKEENNNEYDL